MSRGRERCLSIHQHNFLCCPEVTGKHKNHHVGKSSRPFHQDFPKHSYNPTNCTWIFGTRERHLFSSARNNHGPSRPHGYRDSKSHVKKESFPAQLQMHRKKKGFSCPACFARNPGFSRKICVRIWKSPGQLALRNDGYDCRGCARRKRQDLRSFVQSNQRFPGSRIKPHLKQSGKQKRPTSNQLLCSQ